MTKKNFFNAGVYEVNSQSKRHSLLAGFIVLLAAVIFTMAGCGDLEDGPTGGHTHSYGTAWVSNVTQHWYECTSGDGAKSGIADHTFSDGSCTICGYVQTPAPDGTYTFWPRLRAMQGGADINAYLDRVVVRGGYLTIYIAGVPQGKGGYGSFAGFLETYAKTLLQDLDNPSRSWNVASGGTDEVTGGMFISFQGVTGRRLTLLGNNRTPPYVFEEIILGEPDAQ